MARTKAIAKQTPQDTLAALESWAALEEPDRVRLAAQASRDNDPARVREVEAELKPARRALWSAQRRLEHARASEVRQAADEGREVNPEAWKAAAEALRVAEARIADLERQLDEAEPLFGLLRSYMLAKSKKRTKTSPATLRAYRIGLRSLAEWAATNCKRKLHKLNSDDASRYAAYLESRGLSGASVNARLAPCTVLWKAFRWAGLHRADGADRMEGQNPWADVSGHDGRTAKAKIKAYAAHEFLALLRQAEADVEAARDRFAETGSLAHANRALAARRAIPTLLLGGLAGLRCAELCALEWADVNLATATLTVRDGKGGKTDTVPLASPVVEALEAYKPPQAAGRVLGVEVRRVEDQLKRLAARAGVEWKGVHGLRHHAGTEYYRATRDLRGTQEFLRHSSLAMVQHYVGLVDADVREGVKALGEGFARGLAA